MQDIPHTICPSDLYHEHATIKIIATSELLNFTKLRNTLSPSLLRAKAQSIFMKILEDRFPRIEAYFSEQSGRSGYVDVFLWQDADGYSYGINLCQQEERQQLTLYQLYPVNIIRENSTYYFTDCEYIEAGLFPALPVNALHVQPTPDSIQFPRGLPAKLIACPYTGLSKSGGDVSPEMLWRMSFSTAEESLLEQCEAHGTPLRKLLALMLRLRTEQSQLLLLSPEHYRALVLREGHEHHVNGQRRLSQLLLALLRRMHTALHTGSLQHYFLPRADLLASLGREQLYPLLAFVRVAFQNEHVLNKMLNTSGKK